MNFAASVSSDSCRCLNPAYDCHAIGSSNSGLNGGQLNPQLAVPSRAAGPEGYGSPSGPALQGMLIGRDKK